MTYIQNINGQMIIFSIRIPSELHKKKQYENINVVFIQSLYSKIFCMKTFYENDTITALVQTHITELQAKDENTKEIKNRYIPYIVIWIIGFSVAVRGYFMANFYVILIGAFFTIIATLALIQALIQRRVAMMMKTKAGAL